MRTLFIFCMQKDGVCLNKKEIIQKIIENKGGIVKTSDFADQGINAR